MFPDLPVAMGWRNLAFLNYPVEPATVADRLPDALAVDTYDGDAWLSVVPFTNVAVRPKGLPSQFGFALPELNLRTYVRRTDADGDGAPGVYFYSLDADGDLGVAAARIFHKLPYYRADVSLDTDGTGGVRFASRRTHPGARPATFDATYRPTSEPAAGLGGDPDDPLDARPGTLAEFLTERYRYYTETPGGDLRSAGIQHPRWPLATVDVDVRQNWVFEANGFPVPDREGPHYYSPGVDVTATGSRRVD
ncbi:DUF2071 domain-containing protein [Halorubellus sp. PRR65]|uniref:YqjF family protein n=1 Tax=Halorubellus sp. PRR65 TaxID=3098148 RepID=UPI002B2620CC|nr:DUF2071 domain-containing protein [Halorubellus sp. PRR65]